ncbi:twin-arginine translocation signal domain-containing protein, partial [Shewanella sp. AC91-MNA-CIBAN-0169]
MTKKFSELNRRQFLRQVGISAGAGLLATQSITQALAANTT